MRMIVITTTDDDERKTDELLAAAMGEGLVRMDWKNVDDGTVLILDGYDQLRLIQAKYLERPPVRT